MRECASATPVPSEAAVRKTRVRQRSNQSCGDASIVSKRLVMRMRTRRRGSRLAGTTLSYASAHRPDQRLRLQRAGACATGKSMTRDRSEHALHVLGQDHRPAGNQCARARCREQHQSGARRKPASCADVAAAAAAARGDQRLHVVEQRRRDVNGRGFALPFGQRRGIRKRRELGDARAPIAAGQTDRARQQRPGSRARSPSGSDRAAIRASGYAPICSTGFCVAMTKNGSGSGRVCPSSDTCRSSIASSSALCVFGGARLISSARTTELNTGPW